MILIAYNTHYFSEQVLDIHMQNRSLICEADELLLLKKEQTVQTMHIMLVSHLLSISHFKIKLFNFMHLMLCQLINTILIIRLILS